MVEPFLTQPSEAGWVQLDVSDGTFGSAQSWKNPQDLNNFETSLKMEVHLMMDNIEEKIGGWLTSSVQRIIFHLETSKDPILLINKIEEAGKEVGIAIGLDTSWTRLMPFCNKIDLFQVLAVSPGPSGQEFQEECLEKIKSLRENCSSAIIEVDGGVNREVAKKVKEAGADIVNTGSYIFNSNDIKRAIEELRNI